MKLPKDFKPTELKKRYLEEMLQSKDNVFRLVPVYDFLEEKRSLKIADETSRFLKELESWTAIETVLPDTLQEETEMSVLCGDEVVISKYKVRILNKVLLEQIYELVTKELKKKWLKKAKLDLDENYKLTYARDKVNKFQKRKGGSNPIRDIFLKLWRQRKHIANGKILNEGEDIDRIFLRDILHSAGVPCKGFTKLNEKMESIKDIFKKAECIAKSKKDKLKIKIVTEHKRIMLVIEENWKNNQLCCWAFGYSILIDYILRRILCSGICGWA